MSRNDARKFLAQGTASALTLALGLTFAAQPAFAETAKAADPAPSASAAPSAPTESPTSAALSTGSCDEPRTFGRSDSCGACSRTGSE